MNSLELFHNFGISRIEALAFLDLAESLCKDKTDFSELVSIYEDISNMNENLVPFCVLFSMMEKQKVLNNYLVECRIKGLSEELQSGDAGSILTSLGYAVSELSKLGKFGGVDWSSFGQNIYRFFREWISRSEDKSGIFTKLLKKL